MLKEKILILPAINIKNGVSRSFYFAKELSRYNDVYVTEWDDPQSAEFDKTITGNKLYTLKCFLKSFLSKTFIRKHKKYDFNIIKAPKLTLLVIHKILGVVLALKIIRFYNTIILKRLIKKIKPTVLFYADACDFYPAIVKDSLIVISDVQDDFSEGNFRDNKYQQQYGMKNFNLTHKNYIVSVAAKKRLSTYYNTQFEYIPNGADFENLRKISAKEINDLRTGLNLDGKLIVSFIGGGLWLDTPFAERLFEETLKRSPNVHFILIGNHDQVKPFANVSNLGRMSNDDTYLYYNLSDVGIFLKDSKNSPFLENSMPLKIIQYSAVNKLVITPYINWLEEEKFNNILLERNFSIDNIINLFDKIHTKNFTSDFDNKWNHYNWKEIGKNIDSFIKNKRTELNNN